MSYKWDAQDYRKYSFAQKEWASELMSKLFLSGNESILDIGCGDGKVTFELSQRVIEGYVLGIDSSEDMISLARNTYSKVPNLRFQLKDVRDLDFQNTFDFIFSNAALHWVTDHRSILKRIRTSLKPRGKILLQMGGKGNAFKILKSLDRLISADKWGQYFLDFSFPYGFYAPNEYTNWLKDAGLKATRVELIPKDMIYRNKEELAAWIRTTWLPYTQRVPQDLRGEFISEIVDSYIVENPSTSNLIHIRMMRLEVEAELG